MKIATYDRERFPFDRIVAQGLGCSRLDSLHERLPEGVARDVLPPVKDQQTVLHRRFYAFMESSDEFLGLYRSFARAIGLDVLRGRPFLFQRTPTLRIQLPGGQGSGGASHRDADFHHPDGEINIVVPLTRMFDTNTIFTESAPARRDFQFVELGVGEYLEFDGRNCEHGSVPNQTGLTRVSFDFRLLPRDRYVPSDARAVASGLRFIAGEYYAGEVVAAGASEALA